MSILICGYINIFCLIKRIYFDENYVRSLKQKNEKSICNKRK